MATLNTSLSSEQGHSHALRQIFDKEQVQREINAQMAITRGAAETARAIGTVASQQQAKALIAAAEAGKSADGTYKGKTAAQWQQEADSWGESGTYRIALHTALGVLTGGAVGAAGAAAAATAAQTLNQWESKIAEGLTNSGLPATAGDGIAKALTGVLAGGVGYAAGGTAGAVSGVNEDFNNRQLHKPEKDLAKELARKSKGKYTQAQIEDALRAAANKETGESPADNRTMIIRDGKVVLGSIEDGTHFKQYASRDGSVVFIQDLPTYDVDAGLRKFISENTSGIYSWPVTSSGSGSTLVLRDRLTGLPLDDKGRYTRQVIIEGKLYSPKYFPCATSECQARGYSLDQNDPETKRYAQAMGLKLMSDLSKAATVATMIPAAPVAGAAVYVGTSASLGTILLSTDKWEAAKSEVGKIITQTAAAAVLVKLGHSHMVANDAVAAIDLIGGWDALIDGAKNNFHQK